MADAPSADDGRFRVDSRVEIVYILRALMKSNALVTAYFNAGREFVVTAVLQVDNEQGLVILDSGSNRELNERLLQSPEVSVVSSQDGVRVQFTTDRVTAVSFEGRLAFRLPLPGTIISCSAASTTGSPRPWYTRSSASLPGRTASASSWSWPTSAWVACAWWDSLRASASSPGWLLDDCKIDLPEIGTIRAGLCVRNSYVVTLKNGVTSHRTGCEFVKLGSQQEATVQRYIIRLERERRAKSGDTH